MMIVVKLNNFKHRGKGMGHLTLKGRWSRAWWNQPCCVHHSISRHMSKQEGEHSCLAGTTTLWTINLSTKYSIILKYYHLKNGIVVQNTSSIGHYCVSCTHRAQCYVKRIIRRTKTRRNDKEALSKGMRAFFGRRLTFFLRLALLQSSLI